MNNRIHNATNPHQGTYKKVLCVCSAGLLRSPTAALVLSQEPFNFNTRAAGLVADYALIPVDDVLLFWADEIVCMTEMQAVALSSRVKHTTVICLNIEDSFAYRDEELIKQIGIRYREESEKLKTA